MKPFNLERALAGDPVVTRTGKPVTQLIVFDCNLPHRLFGVLERTAYSWYESGQYRPGSQPSQLDLFMVPKKRTVWINLYGDQYRSSAFYDSQAEADAHACESPKRIGNRAWPLEIED